jgi:hypothetical protein
MVKLGFYFVVKATGFANVSQKNDGLQFSLKSSQISRFWLITNGSFGRSEEKKRAAFPVGEPPLDEEMQPVYFSSLLIKTAICDQKTQNL